MKDCVRRFWQTSVDHRGTVSSPGLVAVLLDSSYPDVKNLNLEPEQTTVAGLVYRLNFSDPRVLQELDFRERNGYTRTVRSIYSHTDPSVSLGKAIVYFSSPSNDTAYAGPIDNQRTIEIIKQASGPSGRNIDYFKSLVCFLKRHDVKDSYVEELNHILEQ